MRSSCNVPLLIFVSAIAGISLGGPVGHSFAVFSGTTATQSAFTAAPDWVPPQVDAAVAGKSEGGEPRYIRSAKGYYLFAQLSDEGNPPSGVAGVTADASALTAGSTNVPLDAGTFSVLGDSYNYRSALLTSDPSLSQGPLSFKIYARDADANQMQASQHSVTVDDVAPAGTEIQTTNGGGVTGAPDEGDTVVFTFSERLDPTTIMPNWLGGTVPVIIKIVDGGSDDPDRLIAYQLDGTTQLALGVLDLKRQGYVSEDVSFGSSTVPSKLEQVGQQVIVKLGTPQGQTAAAEGTARMTLAAGNLSDPAGNPLSATVVSQSASRDAEF